MIKQDATLVLGEPMTRDREPCFGPVVEGSFRHSWHIHKRLPAAYCFVTNCDLPQHAGRRR